MARAMWKGVIRFGNVQIPVKMYSAVQEKDVHFRLLHASDKVPVEQKLIHPVTEKPVAYAETLRGYEIGGEIVVLNQEELEQYEPEESRDIVVHRFVPLEAIDHRWFVRPYWLAPDESSSAYAALVGALEKTAREGLATWTMRREEYRGALRVRDNMLMLVTLRPASDIVSAKDLGAPEARTSTAAERKMAEQLIAALSGEFDPSEWKDEYRERVLELVDAKARGKVVSLPRYRPDRRPESLLGALSASVAAAKKGGARGHNGETEASPRRKQTRGSSRARTKRRTGS